MSLASQFIRSNQEVTAPKKKGAKNPHRVVSEDGTMFIQPTGGNGKKYNFTYCYLGFYDAEGGYISGFSIDNIKMLELVSAKVLPDSVTKLFSKYADANPEEQVVKA